MQERIKRILGDLHSTLFLAILIPTVYAIALDNSHPVEEFLWLKCWIIAIPIFGSEVAIRKCKYLISYLGISAILLFGTTELAWWITTCMKSSAMMAGYVIGIHLETAVLILLRVGYRLERAREEKDFGNAYSEKHQHILDEPSTGALVVLILIYLVGLNFDRPRLCNAALISVIAYIMVRKMYQYIAGSTEYIYINRRVKNLSKKRYWWISSMGFLIYSVGVLMIATISILNIPNRNYHNLRDHEWVETGNLQEEILQEIAKDPDTSGAGIWNQDHSVESPPLISEKWIRRFEKLFMILLSIIATIAVIRIILQFFRKFSESYIEEEDLIEALKEEPQDRHQKLQHRLEDRNLAKVRRRYKKMIRKYISHPAETMTPLELEEIAGIQDDTEVQGLHREYEKARYSDPKRKADENL